MRRDARRDGVGDGAHLGVIQQALLAALHRDACSLLPAHVQRLTRADAWNPFLVLTLLERAEGAVLRAFEGLPPGTVPAERHEQLRRATLMTGFRQHRLHARLFEALDILDGAGIPVVLLKGAATAHLAFARFVDRPMNDVDLLVPAERAMDAQRLLQQAGWRCDAGAEHAEDFYREHSHLAPLRDETDLGLEVHVDLHQAMHPFALDARAVFARTRRLSVLGPRGAPRVVLVPDAHDLVVHAATHLAWSHVFRSGFARWVLDLSALVDGGHVDWEQVVDRARVSRAATCAYWTLRLARTLTGVPVPAHVEAALRPRLPDLLIDRLARHLAHQTLAVDRACPSMRIERILWSLSIQPGASGHAWRRPWVRAVRYRTVEDAGGRAAPRKALEAHPSRAMQALETAGYLWRIVAPRPARDAELPR